MRSLALVCVIVITLSYNVADDWYTNDYVEMLPHEGHEIECGRNGVEIRKQMKDVECVPRYTLVELIPPMGFIFLPSYARVKRCSGFCYPNKSCMPVDANSTTATVRMLGLGSKYCYKVSVEEHTRCKCQCRVKKEHCKPHQVYSASRCACECRKRKNCNSERGMVWNEDKCECVCRREMPCNTGLEWVPSLCRCAKVMVMQYND